MSLQVVVITHDDGIAAFQRHEKYWKAFDSPILVVTPKGSKGKYDHETLAIGKAGRACGDSIVRLQALFDNLSNRNWDRCVIYEYDSFSIKAELTSDPGLFGIVFRNDQSPQFMAPRYANPPWSFDRPSFDRMREKAASYRFNEYGEADRWISALAFLAGVPILDYQPLGFSRNTISAADIPSLMDAIKQRGATQFHGVKQEWVLRAIEQFYDEANPHE